MDNIRKQNLAVLILVVLICGYIFASIAEARQSPAARNCRIAGGQSWVLNIGSADDLELCLFGKGMIASETLYNYTVIGSDALAVQIYLQNKSGARGSSENFCTQNAGNILELFDSNNVAYSVCAFSDGSSIELETLARGSMAEENADLSAALKNSNR